MPKPSTSINLFIELANPSEYGISDFIDISKFVGKYACLKHTNGGSWARMDGVGELQKKFSYISIKKNEIRYSRSIKDESKELIDKEVLSWRKLPNTKLLEERSKGNAIIAYKLVKNI